MKFRISKATLEERLDSASDEDLHRAAEAVVDAAICCQKLRGSAEISERTRNLLIEAVLRDPTLTYELFSGWAFD